MHRRQVGEWKSITKTGLQGRGITLGCFSWFSESSPVSYSHSAGTTWKALGSSLGQENLPARGGGYSTERSWCVFQKQQLLQDDTHDKMPPGQISCISVKKSWMYVKSTMAYKALSKPEMRVLLCKGQSRAQFGTGVKTSDKTEQGN